jgi:hypothetical protein
MIDPTHDGVRIRVRVIPRAARPGLAGTRAGALLVRLSAPPVEGAANAELVEIIARALGRPKQDVAVERGAGSRSKTIRVRGVTGEEAARALAVR